MTDAVDRARERLVGAMFAEWDAHDVEELVRLMRKFADALSYKNADKEDLTNVRIEFLPRWLCLQDGIEGAALLTGFSFMQARSNFGEVRQPIPAEPGQLERYDYEYRGNGTVNLFVCIDVHRPWRKVITERRAAEDYAQCMRELTDVPLSR